jgi:REP element-mobilizing transposase RayT
VADHVHVLVGLRATHTLADFVREMKKAGTIWVHDQGLETAFAWQEGYAAFTISPGVRPRVKGYIANQEKHHQRKTYIEELTLLLAQAEIEYDPRFLE